MMEDWPVWPGRSAQTLPGSSRACGVRPSAGSFSSATRKSLAAAPRRGPPACYRLPECSAKSSRRNKKRNKKEVDSSCDIRVPSTISHIGVRVAPGAELGEHGESWAGGSPATPNCSPCSIGVSRRCAPMPTGFGLARQGQLQMMGRGVSCMSDLLLCLTRRRLPVFPRGRVQSGQSGGFAGCAGWPGLPHACALCVLLEVAEKRQTNQPRLSGSAGTVSPGRRDDDWNAGQIPGSVGRMGNE